MPTVRNRPLRLMVAVDDDHDTDDLAREFSRKGFDVRVTSNRAEVMQRARDNSADLFVLRTSAHSADMLLLAEQLQSVYPGLAGRILFLPKDSAKSIRRLVGELAPVMHFLRQASERLGGGSVPSRREGSA